MPAVSNTAPAPDEALRRIPQPLANRDEALGGIRQARACPDESLTQSPSFTEPLLQGGLYTCQTPGYPGFYRGPRAAARVGDELDAGAPVGSLHLNDLQLAPGDTYAIEGYLAGAWVALFSLTSASPQGAQWLDLPAGGGYQRFRARLTAAAGGTKGGAVDQYATGAAGSGTVYMCPEAPIALDEDSMPLDEIPALVTVVDEAYLTIDELPAVPPAQASTHVQTAASGTVDWHH